MIEFRGFAELGGRFKQAPVVQANLLLAAARNVGFIGERISKKEVKRVTGQLGNSITSQVTAEAGWVIVRVGTAMPYGRAQNYGFPSGYPLVYAKGRDMIHGRAIPGGRTRPYKVRPYTAHSHGRPARPFLDPTLEEHQAELLVPVEDARERLVKYLAGR